MTSGQSKKISYTKCRLFTQPKLTKYGIITHCTYWPLAEATKILTKYGISLCGDISSKFQQLKKAQKNSKTSIMQAEIVCFMSHE
jgi:hypothetical protein